jgi:hypothetical protein
MSTQRRDELDEFYVLLGRLEQRCGETAQLVDCTGRMQWPQRGVYFFFETGEVRDDGVTPRVVRVGTHGLRPSRSTLWGRLSQHRGNVGGSMPGGGNHRGSVFRLHVGNALLASGDWSDAIRATWSIGSNAPRETREREHPLEVAVSDHIGRMPFLWLAVEDAPGPESHRGVIERGAIGLLSNFNRPALDPPSSAWLGRHARRDAIGASGLWNVNHVRDKPTPELLPLIDTYLSSQEPRTR